jgi:hypothetical protein
MVVKRLILIIPVVLFIFGANALGGEPIITGEYKGFTLIKADWPALQEIMEKKGFSRYVIWSAFTDPLIRRIHVTPLDHELKCIDDIKYRIRTAIRDREIQQEVAAEERIRKLFK